MLSLSPDDEDNEDDFGNFFAGGNYRSHTSMHEFNQQTTCIHLQLKLNTIEDEKERLLQDIQNLVADNRRLTQDILSKSEDIIQTKLAYDDIMNRYATYEQTKKAEVNFSISRIAKIDELQGQVQLLIDENTNLKSDVKMLEKEKETYSLQNKNGSLLDKVAVEEFSNVKDTEKLLQLSTQTLNERHLQHTDQLSSLLNTIELQEKMIILLNSQLSASLERATDREARYNTQKKSDDDLIRAYENEIYDIKISLLEHSDSKLSEQNIQLECTMRDQNSKFQLLNRDMSNVIQQKSDELIVLHQKLDELTQNRKSWEEKQGSLQHQMGKQEITLQQLTRDLNGNMYQVSLAEDQRKVHDVMLKEQGTLLIQTQTLLRTKTEELINAKQDFDEKCKLSEMKIVGYDFRLMNNQQTIVNLKKRNNTRDTAYYKNMRVLNEHRKTIKQLTIMSSKSRSLCVVMKELRSMVCCSRQ